MIDGDLVLARFDNDVVTARDVITIIVERNQFDLLLLQSAQGKVAAAVRDTLPGIAYHKAVAALARKEGLDKQDSFQAKRTQIINKKLGQLVLDVDTKLKIRVTEDDVDRYYRDHPSKFTNPETYTFRGIVSLDKNWGRERARKRLQEVLKRLDAGDDFADVARKYSDSAPYLRGKPQGPRTRGDAGMPVEVEAAILSLATGEYTRILERPKGVAIYQLIDRTAAKKKDLTPLLRLRIQSEIFQERRSREEQILVEQLFKRDVLTYKPELMNKPAASDDMVALEIRGFPHLTVADLKREIGLSTRMTTSQRSDWFIDRASSLLLLAEARRRGYTEEDVAPRIAYWERSELEKEYLKFLLRNQELSGDELREYYNQHSNEFATKSKYTIYHIFISAELHKDMSVFQRNLAFDRARSKADEVYRRIATEGIAFQDAAQEYSSDRVTGRQGGYVGQVALSDLGPEFHTLFQIESQLQPGLITPPQSARDYEKHLGFDLYYCTDIQPSRPLSFPEALPLIGKKLAEQKREQRRLALHKKITQETPLTVDNAAVEQLAKELKTIRMSSSSDAELLKALLPRSRVKALNL